VKKTVTRQTLKPYVLSGKYSGSISGTVSACTVPSDNNPKFRARYNLTVTQAGDDTSAKLIFTFVDTNDGIICTATGPLSHFGRLYKMSNAKYTCLGPGFPAGNQTIVTIDSLHPTEQGIEGALSGPTPDGCVVDYSFSAVLNN
jgi:hypothetical protein